MNNKKLQKILVPVTLILLVVSAFYVRISNFKNNTIKYSIDEMVYYGLGLQLKENILDYNTVRIADLLVEEDPALIPLPDYFYKPLFKHPPLFSYCVTFALGMFGGTTLAAVLFSCLFGSLIIILGYFLGKLFFDEQVGLFTAACLWLDPINIICSQKIWMDTTVSFFSVLSILFFGYGIKRGNDRYFLLSGLACGFALLTKYSGGLALIVILLYTIICAPELFRNRKFIYSLFIPFLMLLPWMFWNFTVYGSGFLGNQLNIYNILTGRKWIILYALLALILLWGVIFRVLNSRKVAGAVAEGEELIETDDSRSSAISWRNILVRVYGIAFLCLLSKSIFHAFHLKHFPFVTWQGGHFQHSLFYFERLIEFFLLYAFSFLALFFYNEKRSGEAILLYISVIAVFIFYLNWGVYQSRYILAITPFLLVLGVRFYQELFEKVSGNKNKFLRLAGQIVLVSLAVFMFIKTSYVNFMVSYPNNMCYF